MTTSCLYFPLFYHSQLSAQTIVDCSFKCYQKGLSQIYDLDCSQGASCHLCLQWDSARKRHWLLWYSGCPGAQSAIVMALGVLPSIQYHFLPTSCPPIQITEPANSRKQKWKTVNCFRPYPFAPFLHWQLNWSRDCKAKCWFKILDINSYQGHGKLQTFYIVNGNNTHLAYRYECPWDIGFDRHRQQSQVFHLPFDN